MGRPQGAGAGVVAREPNFRQSAAELSVGGAQLAASVVTWAGEKKGSEAVSGGRRPCCGRRRCLVLVSVLLAGGGGGERA